VRCSDWHRDRTQTQEARAQCSMPTQGRKKNLRSATSECTATRAQQQQQQQPRVQQQAATSAACEPHSLSGSRRLPTFPSVSACNVLISSILVSCTGQERCRVDVWVGGRQGGLNCPSGKGGKSE
jgi:hypothetical protein